MINAMRLICSKMAPSVHPWLVEGDTALALQGVAIPSTTIRIITDRLGTFELGKHLQGFGPGIQTQREGTVVSYTGAYKLFEVPVAIIGDWRLNCDKTSVLIPVDELFQLADRVPLDSYRIPVVPLTWQLMFDILQNKDRKRLDLIMAEAPEKKLLCSLLERFGIYNEFKELVADLWRN